VKSQRAVLTPQMLQYDDFDDRSQTRWLPYLMYFHRAGYHSDVINTDQRGFRISHGRDQRASAGGSLPAGPVRLLVGSSTAFGIGVTADAATMASRLWTQYAPSLPWLNFAGRSFASTQEAILFLLYHHLLPPIERIVFFSGLNDLALSRLPAEQRGDHGGFFNCGEYYEQMEELRARHRKPQGGFGWRGKGRPSTPALDTTVLPLADRIANAVELTSRHLESWRLLAPGVPVSYVLQPLATWIREQPAPQEKLLFGELDEISNFWQLYGDISTKEAGRTYAAAMRAACEKQDVSFVDISPVIADAVGEQDWLFVDRAHFTDFGADVVSRLVAEQLSLS
jgi:hypothetical protein